MIRRPSDLWRGWVCACQFLTRLPVPTLSDYRSEDQGHALPLFPWVGLLIGGLLATAALTLSLWLPAAANAAIVVALWALITGGLHLDGLSDSADGWLAGGERERTLTIMKDPRCGSAAVIAVNCLLLLKFALLLALIQQQQWLALLLAPLFGRALALVLLLTTPYISPAGTGTNFLQHSARSQLRLSAALAWLLLLYLLPLAASLLLTALGLLLLIALRRLMLQRLGGTNGDTCGALIELAEVALLLATLTAFTSLA